MLDKFWESIGSDLAEQWIEYIFGPAFLFWSGGLALLAWQIDWKPLQQNTQTLTAFQQGSIIVLGLLVLVFSSMVVKAIRFPILRILEGYWPWPFSYLGLGLLAIQKYFYKNKYAKLRHLKVNEAQREPNAKEQEKLIKLDVWSHWNPTKSSDLLPTRLGNILRARERAPERRYGLDAIVCWPRLWSLLPENMRGDISSSRSALDRLVELWLWGALFLLWTLVNPWAILISVVWMVVVYDMSTQAAMAYGDLIETAFDLYRMPLYDALAWPRPKNSDEEKTLGKELTEFLWRGTVNKEIIYRE